jgi:hypothetical protein
MNVGTVVEDTALNKRGDLSQVLRYALGLVIPCRTAFAHNHLLYLAHLSL